MTVAGDALEDYFRTLTSVDAVEATGLVLDLLGDGTPVAQITTEVLAAAQVRVGQLWERGEWSVADEHAATAVTDTALSALTAAAGRRHRGHGRHVAVTCAEGEWHTLPARMAAAIAAAGDVRVTVLGPSMPADHLGRRLQTGDVDVLALSCTVPTNLVGAARCVQAAHAAGVPVVAGGRAFGGDARRAEAIGADAWAADAAELAAPSPALAGRPVDIPTEVLLLDAPGDAVVQVVYERLVGAYPRVGQLAAWQRQRTREDLAWMSRYSGAAVLTGDPTVLDDFLAWALRLLDRRVPADVLTTSAHLVADTVEPDAPRGAAMLRAAADRAGTA